MTKKRLPYDEGTWFGVPLRDGGYGLGVVARMDGKGCAFGYFFGPSTRDVPELSDAIERLAKNAVYCGHFGDLAIIRGEWPILGKLADWDRAKWPVPPCVRKEDISGRTIVTYYSDTDLRVIREEMLDSRTEGQYPRSALSGAGALEVILTRALA